MPTWDEVVAEISAGQTSAEPLAGQWRPWIARRPIVIMGPSGAGKTALWSRLTGEDAPDVLSESTDEGYSFPRNRTGWALVTIPGQGLRERIKPLDEIFSPAGRLSGVIFVADYGFDYIWPSLSNQVAADLSRKNLSALRTRNITRELASYKETCDRILQKFDRATSSDARPKWLLVIVNKADLYWPEIDKVRSYYTFGCRSDFDKVTQKFVTDLGNIPRFTYRVIPAAMRPVGYRFRSDMFSYDAHSGLNSAQCDSSFHAVVKTLEELCEI